MTLPWPQAPSSPPATAASRALLAVAFALTVGACGKAPIPERVDPEAIKKELLAADPARLLTGGNRIFFDDFERTELGDRWVIERIPSEPRPPVWRLEGGWLRNNDAKNQGAWVKAIPETGNVRIEFLAVSDPPVRGAFVGDLKCEAFATEPLHEKGYSFINGGWNNTLDTIAKLGEHSADDKRVPATPVVEGQVHRYAVILDERQLHFFRDGQHLYTFDDPAPVRGPWFGFNNWLTNARFDELAIYTF